ncbi:hypothetical protein U1769_24105 [Sphingomonas sp. ZT3P38]|uniref:hypothetical protein n=1 Tax=Parasphingomonas zepuensis TaxID=3096161 RepID=UPI002FC799B2
MSDIWPVIRLPIDVAGTYYATPSDTPPMLPTDAETSAHAHWLFGVDNPTDLDLISGQKMRRHIVTPTITAGGSGYTTATVAVTGGGGTGATAVAVLSSGAVSRIYFTSYGSGFTSNPTLTITGDGTGATATAALGGLATRSGSTIITPITGWNGLHSGVPELPEQTVWGIFKYDTTAGVRALMGTASNKTGETGGWVLLASAANIQIITNGISGSAVGVTKPAWTNGDFVFIAVRHVAGTETVLSGLGNALTLNTRAGTKDATATPARDIGLGPTYYGMATAAGVYAEFGVIDYAMSDAEILAVYLRSRARLAARPTPITVV